MVKCIYTIKLIAHHVIRRGPTAHTHGINKALSWFRTFNSGVHQLKYDDNMTLSSPDRQGVRLSGVRPCWGYRSCCPCLPSSGHGRLMQRTLLLRCLKSESHGFRLGLVRLTPLWRRCQAAVYFWVEPSVALLSQPAHITHNWVKQVFLSERK